MASAVEQLASGFNFSTFAKAEDLKKRIWFTLAALVVYRFGTYIPLPGINPDVIREFTQDHSGGILGILDMFSGDIYNYEELMLDLCRESLETRTQKELKTFL